MTSPADLTQAEHAEILRQRREEVLKMGGPEKVEPNEVVLRISVRGENPKHIAAFGKELAPLISGPPGLTGLLGGGRTRPSRILAYWPALVPAELIKVTVDTKEIS